MKNKTLFIVLALGVIGTLSLMGFVSATKQTDFILVRTLQGSMSVNMAKTMIISKSDGTSERITLKNIDLTGSNAEDNLNTEVEKIKEIMESGYELKSFTGGGGGNGAITGYDGGFGMTYTYLFVKK